MRKFAITVSLLSILLLGACIPVPVVAPYERPFPDEMIRFLDDESTTRETVLLTLGEPNGGRDDDRWFVYTAEREVGGLILLQPFNISGSKGRSVTKHWFLFIEFDDYGAVARHQVVTGRENLQCVKHGTC